ncbi:hypothetical protein DCAR_0207820 [Daucus carota subsp. sativus]|uniref:Riboflavin biosynthesis protein PYRD, chloroplastic n=1 Tax=Daucus carota subsp. sativus TaxID=79200 RepID=A0AAF0WI76_DAUCS|nr:PREDICTED: riboflavin biosynthesis protein PYRD, chloroplastic [Daucus carota subsp. sativus]WOG88585.1 hypothetical protein DCAR_0207820 [Daucus carota subsp. sativus]
MYVQTISSPNYKFNSINLSPSAQFLNPQSSKLGHNYPIYKSGFCNLVKRVSETPMFLKIRGGSIGIRCDGSFGKDEKDNENRFYMRRALELAKKATGYTSPNPLVGCVIVNDGKIVGEGFHPKAGQPHAEVFALRDAGDLAENGTAYVTLEPCNHFGRTPPCSEALIKAKVKNVVVGMVDPNPIVASKGVDKLRAAGIDVTVGVEEDMCKKLNEGYIHQMLTGKPFVTLRCTLSVDGNLTDQLGEEVVAPGGYYSKLLQEYDAVILSSTLLAQTSSLPLSNEPGANQPLKIVIAKSSSSQFQIPVSPNELTSKVIVFSDKEMDVGSQTAQQGIETVVLEKISLLAILEYCKGLGLCSVLLDLRGDVHELEETLREGFELSLIQKVLVEALPEWDISKEEVLPVTLKNLGKGLKLKNLVSHISGKILLIEGYF